MADTRRTLNELQARFSDSGFKIPILPNGFTEISDTSPQDIRDFLLSVYPVAIPASNYSGADSGARIQAAIDAIASTGGVVLADFSGSQTINAGLVIKPGVTVFAFPAEYDGATSRWILVSTN